MDGKLVTMALAALPYVGFGALILYCRMNTALNLNNQMEITPLMRKALHAHFWYFIACPIMIEVFLDAVPGLNYIVGTMPPATTNGRHFLQCLAAENFFVTSVSLGFILNQSSVPRWALMTPFAQLAWNLKNHLSWFFIPLAPEGRMPFAFADMVLIWPITAVYVHTLFTTKKSSKKKG